MKIEYDVPELDLFNISDIIEVQNTDNDKSIFKVITNIEFDTRFSYIDGLKDKHSEMLKYMSIFVLSVITIGGYYNAKLIEDQIPIQKGLFGRIYYDKIKDRYEVVGHVNKDLVIRLDDELELKVKKYPGNLEKINQLCDEMMGYVKNDGYEVTPIELDIKETNIKIGYVERIELETIKNEG